MYIYIPVGFDFCSHGSVLNKYLILFSCQIVFVLFNSSMTCATNGTETSYPSGAPDSPSVVYGVHVAQFLVKWFADHCLSYWLFFSSRYIVCPSIYGF